MRGRTLPQVRAVLFDWDGTIVDSAEASFRCYERLFRSFDIAYDRGEFQRTYSPDWYRTYALLGLARERWSEADAMWLELYAGEKCALLAGAAEAVRSLREAGIPCGIVTSGSRGRVLSEDRLARAGRFLPDPGLLRGLRAQEAAPRAAPGRGGLGSRPAFSIDVPAVGDAED